MSVRMRGRIRDFGRPWFGKRVTYEPEWLSGPRPAELEPGQLYISCKDLWIGHLCPCGCGSEIDVILFPDAWRFSFDGKRVSIMPSIGNFHLPCQSHYFIIDNAVKWAQPTWGQGLRPLEGHSQ